MDCGSPFTSLGTFMIFLNWELSSLNYYEKFQDLPNIIRLNIFDKLLYLLMVIKRPLQNIS